MTWRSRGCTDLTWRDCCRVLVYAQTVIPRLKKRLFTHKPAEAIEEETRKLIYQAAGHWGSKRYDFFQNLQRARAHPAHSLCFCVATTPHVARRVQWPSQAVSERRTRSAERCALAALTCADHLALCVQAASNREHAAVGGWQASCRGSPPRRAVAALVPSSSVRAGGECWPYRHCVLGVCARAGRGAAAIGLRGGAPVSRHHPQARGEPDRS
jgi:hypothetical protein